ncbi:MFS transporter [Microlunatus elymi]|uniref:MFS transporter n=1 Tax=Microlunatus elymi TaxID=2596828 RepID=A0A516Q0M9_9ACTN|nr:MFS transporter [Microlunatus elymi]QDP96993.1 MFS transporter [Microlunatus elymi]
MIRSSGTPAGSARRNFNRLWLAQSTSLVGLQTGAITVPLLAVDVLHADASHVALLGTLSSLPWLIAPVIGAVADCVDRRQLLVVAHLGRTLLWLSIPVCYLAGVLTISQLWLVSVAVGVLGVVFAVAYRAFLPTIVPASELGSANGRMGGTDAVARSVGPALAGYLIQLLGAVWAVLVQVVAAAVAGIATATIRSAQSRSTTADHDQQRTPAGWWRGIVDGFRCVYRIKPLRRLALAETGYLFFFEVGFAIVIVFFRNTLGIGAGTIGLIFSIGSLGGMLGATIANRLRAFAGLDATIRTAAILRGLGIAVLPLSVVVPGHVVVITVLIGGRALNAAAWSVYEVLTDTYQQTTLPDRHRGSATAVILWLGNGATTVGAAVTAAVATTLDTTVLLAAAGIGCTAAGCLTVLVRTESHSGPRQ